MVEVVAVNVLMVMVMMMEIVTMMCARQCYTRDDLNDEVHVQQG